MQLFLKANLNSMVNQMTVLIILNKLIFVKTVLFFINIVKLFFWLQEWASNVFGINIFILQFIVDCER